jgi:hypothetical protein
VISNSTSDPAYYSYASAAYWYSPIATTGGALWINSGGGPVLYNSNADVNMQLNVQAPAPYGWTTVAMLLLGNGTATGDITGSASGYPGMFWANDSQSPVPIPGTNDLTGPTFHFNMEMYIWTGNYSTYAAAQAAAAAHTAGAYIADSGVFSEFVPYGNPPPVGQPLADMPAMILSQNPIPLILGDANGDGKVDINDLTIVLTNFGQSLGLGAWAKGDFTGDGTVDINDLTIVLTNFGHTSSAAALSAVPEPASAVLLVCCGLAALVGQANRGARRRGMADRGRQKRLFHHRPLRRLAAGEKTGGPRRNSDIP